MAGFLRRLTSDAGKPNGDLHRQVSAPRPLGKTDASVANTPVYARFATSRTSLNFQPGTSVDPRMVSGPMPLNGNRRAAGANDRVMASARRDVPLRNQAHRVTEVDEPTNTATGSEYENFTAVKNFSSPPPTTEPGPSNGHEMAEPRPSLTMDKPLPSPVEVQPFTQNILPTITTSPGPPGGTSTQPSHPSYLDKKPLPTPAPEPEPGQWRSLSRKPSLPQNRDVPKGPPTPSPYPSSVSHISPPTRIPATTSHPNPASAPQSKYQPNSVSISHHQQEYTLSTSPPPSMLPTATQPPTMHRGLASPPPPPPPPLNSQEPGPRQNTAFKHPELEFSLDLGPPIGASLFTNGVSSPTQVTQSHSGGRNEQALDFDSGQVSKEYTTTGLSQRRPPMNSAPLEQAPPFNNTPNTTAIPPSQVPRNGTHVETPPLRRAPSSSREPLNANAQVTAMPPSQVLRNGTHVEAPLLRRAPSSSREPINANAQVNATPPVGSVIQPAYSGPKRPNQLTRSNTSDRYPPPSFNNPYSQGQTPVRKASVRSISDTPLDAPVRSGPLIFAAMAEVPESPPPPPAPLIPPPQLSRRPSLNNYHPPAEYESQRAGESRPPPDAAAFYGSSFPRAPVAPSTSSPPPPQSRGYSPQPPQSVNSVVHDVSPRKLSKSASRRPSRDFSQPLPPPSSSNPHMMSTSSVNLHTHSSSTTNGVRNGAPPELNGHHHNGHEHAGGHRVLTKARHSVTPAGRRPTTAESDYQSIRNSVLNLVDGDPFAKAEGVTMLGHMQEDYSQMTVAPLNLVKRNSPPANGQGRTIRSPNSADSSIQGKERKGMVGPNARHSPQHSRTMFAPPPGAVIISPHRRSPRPSDISPFAYYLADPELLSSLLSFLTFYDWCTLWAVSKHIRTLLDEDRSLREIVLERFLRPVGYRRWIWETPDPLPLSLRELNDYMREVSTPVHQYAQVSQSFIQSSYSRIQDPFLLNIVRQLSASTRAYTRVVLRLRAQAEESENRAIPTPDSPQLQNRHSDPARTTVPFRSPLFRLRRAPLLHVFVPSPDGDWLSDKSVVECEEELKRAGVLSMLRIGDVIWDVAVGDDGNVGRLIWDGAYLIDLDYTYSTLGDLPKYLNGLAFSPSYFHRVINTGPAASNPVVHIDISPWGKEIAANVQLLQDTIRTETPQGNYHNVVRWSHRSSFELQKPPKPPPRSQYKTGPPPNQRIPIPGTDGLFVDPGWYGTVMVEAEGTNEGLADLQERCGPGAFPPHASLVNGRRRPLEELKVFRILRERSRPGEIWLRAIGKKEKIVAS